MSNIFIHSPSLSLLTSFFSSLYFPFLLFPFNPPFSFPHFFLPFHSPYLCWLPTSIPLIPSPFHTFLLPWCLLPFSFLSLVSSSYSLLNSGLIPILFYMKSQEAQGKLRSSGWLMISLFSSHLHHAKLSLSPLSLNSLNVYFPSFPQETMQRSPNSTVQFPNARVNGYFRRLSYIQPVNCGALYLHASFPVTTTCPPSNTMSYLEGNWT